MPGQDPTQFQVQTAKAADPALLEGYSIIEIGKPADLPQLAADQFPALVFDKNNLLSSESAVTQVTKPAEDSDDGYAAISGFSGEPDRNLLAVLGNSSSGLNYSLQAVLASESKSDNFAISMSEGERVFRRDES